MFNNPNSLSNLEQAFKDVIKTVAVEETALSNILNLESDLLQKAKNNSMNLEEFVSINESVNSIMRNITKVQMMTQIKLHFVEELLQKSENLDENDALEE
ncbi:MAG: hypothetical protein ACM3X9_01790 [Bacillota bacterium]